MLRYATPEARFARLQMRAARFGKALAVVVIPEDLAEGERLVVTRLFGTVGDSLDDSLDAAEEALALVEERRAAETRRFIDNLVLSLSVLVEDAE